MKMEAEARRNLTLGLEFAKSNGRTVFTLEFAETLCNVTAANSEN